MTRPSAQYLRGQRIDPTAISGKETVADLIDNAFLAYNAGRLREGCQLFTQRMLEPDVTVGMTPHRRDDAGGALVRVGGCVRLVAEELHLAADHLPEFVVRAAALVADVL